MIEAVENHMPQVIVIDEIGTELEAPAARTIAERGVQLIGTAHGNNLDNLMLNPTLSDLIGGIQSVTLGDEEARRRRTQKSVLERKAPPTFDVIIEIQDRERVMVHADVAETVDAMLRGDPVAPELRWRDEEGVHRSARRDRGRRRGSSSAPSGSRASSAAARAGGSSPAGAAMGAIGGLRRRRWLPRCRRCGREPGGGAGFRSGYRPGASGGWRRHAWRIRSRDHRARLRLGGWPSRPVDDSRVMPGERLTALDAAGRPTDPARRSAVRRREIADRGPLERGATAVIPSRAPARSARLERQNAWREQASQALDALKVDEGMAPVNLDDLDDEDDRTTPIGSRRHARARRDGILHVQGAGALPTIRVLPQGVSRKRLEQGIRELQLPVVVARDVDEADVVMTLKSEYRQKTPMLREAEDRAMPIYVLKSNTQVQIQASLTSIFALEIDPREAALRETEDAIDLVLQRSEPVELSPQNAFIRRLQHQMAERANLVSRSRGREPYRRVRLYPEAARAAWR